MIALGVLGDSDEHHPSCATAMGRVLCTANDDLLGCAPSGIDHAGIVYGRQRIHLIGGRVQEPELICGVVLTSDDIRNDVEYL